MIIPYILLVICTFLQVSNGKTLFKRHLDYGKDAAADNKDAVIAKNVDKFDIAQVSASEEELGNAEPALVSSKRSVDDAISPKNNYLKYKKRRSPLGVVYSQGKPIGILEPISKIYDFQEIDELEPLKAQTKREEVLEDDHASHEITKRDSDKKVESGSKDKVKVSQDSKSKRESSEKRLGEIEDNIKEVMSDLGLIGDDKNSPLKRLGRNVGDEDEDLDSGVNKIGLTKEAHSYERNKKENSPASKVEAFCANTNANTKLKAVHKIEDLVDNNDASIEGSSAKKVKKERIVDYSSEGESFVRKKRDQAKNENSDLMKGLESSGDLTVSGNKSPLASSAVEADKRKAGKQENKEEKREKQVENEEYEKRLQRNLESKIKEIKEEVKREVRETKKIGKKREVGGKDTDKDKKLKVKGRKKRNLLDMETSDLDPDLNLEDYQEAHVRKRRAAADDEKDENKRILSWTNINNDNNVEVNKREDSSHHDPKMYEFHYKNKRDSNGKERLSNSGFWDAQNQNAAGMENTRAIVTRDSTRNAPVASESYLQPTNNFLDSKRLEKLISESASLTESIKNERGASPIEVELHTANKNDILKAHDRDSPSKREKSDSKKEVKRDTALDQGEAVAGEDKYQIFEDANKLGQDVKLIGSSKNDNIDKRSDKRGARKMNRLDEIYDDGFKTSRFERSNGASKDPSSISLEDMQKIDSESSNKRKRRDLDYQQPNMQIKNYRADEEEADDESDEFDDDNFDDRTANFIRKRAVDQNYNQNKMLRNYVAGINADVYDNPNYLYESDDSARKKRQVADDLAALHSGGPMVNHLAAVKERNMQPINANYRRKRLERLNQKQVKDQSITGLSESDIFGGLPQSYEGELSRFKRVKRDGTDK